MKKIVIFGNSGSGKSILAKDFAVKFELPHLDLDILAWQDTDPPTRKPLKDSVNKIEQFLEEQRVGALGETKWVIEGCYSNLLALALKNANDRNA